MGWITFSKVEFVKMSKIKLYQNNIKIFFEPEYGMVKINLWSIQWSLSDYLLKILKCTTKIYRVFQKDWNLSTILQIKKMTYMFLIL